MGHCRESTPAERVAGCCRQSSPAEDMAECCRESTPAGGKLGPSFIRESIPVESVLSKGRHACERESFASGVGS